MRVIEEGQLKGSFKGFKDNKTVFKFFGGQKWQQNEYNYNYFYAYMPNAKVIDESGQYYLVVEGMNDKVAVKQIR
jgi:hypothetical protein